MPLSIKSHTAKTDNFMNSPQSTSLLIRNDRLGNFNINMHTGNNAHGSTQFKYWLSQYEDEEEEAKRTVQQNA